MIGRSKEVRPAWSKDAKVKLGDEEGDLQTVSGDGVALRANDTRDESLEAKASEVIGHPAG
jgi:hypothetical protein